MDMCWKTAAFAALHLTSDWLLRNNNFSAAIIMEKEENFEPSQANQWSTECLKAAQ